MIQEPSVKQGDNMQPTVEDPCDCKAEEVFREACVIHILPPTHDEGEGRGEVVWGQEEAKCKHGKPFVRSA
jgi:hypothetical protein